MEQHSARTPAKNDAVPPAVPGQPGTAGPRLPGQAPGGSAAPSGDSRETAERGPAAQGTRLARLRLTGLGTGLMLVLITLAGAAVDAMLPYGHGMLFGLVFVAGCVVAALWVWPYDLAAAPVSAPIAFALALAVTGDSGGGLSGRAIALVTGLALQTGWLYGGTLCAAVIAGVRKLAAVRRRRRG